MEKRRKNPAGLIPDVEFANGETNSDDNQKESKTFYLTAFAGFLILICLVFFSSSAAGPLRQHYGISGEASKVQKFEMEVDLSPEHLQPRTEVKPLGLRNDEKAKQITPSVMMVDLTKKCQRLIEDARSLKNTGVVMETDERAQKITGSLQSELKELLKLRFPGDGTILVEMELEFPASMINEKYTELTDTITIELAPYEYVPYSVFYFLEIVRKFKAGAFHRNAGHVLQSMIALKDIGNDRYSNRGLAFQEYDPRVPHKELTLGYAGRPGGPPFYISTVDNTNNHGPGSQGSRSEADSCFGKVVVGKEVVQRMMSQPGGVPPNGFISNPDDHIKILSIKLITPDAGDIMYEIPEVVPGSRR